MTHRRCDELHNPGEWPYVARCVRPLDHDGLCKDKYGNEWKRRGER